mgnify:FL=1
MGYQLANINGRAALVQGDHYFDLERVSGGVLSSDAIEALRASAQLNALAADLDPASADGL